MALSKASALLPAQLHDSVLPAVKQHRVLVASAVLFSPLIYFSLKFWLWLRKSQKKWKVLSDNFPGPKKHWLYGNLHQVNERGEYGLDLTVYPVYFL